MRQCDMKAAPGEKAVIELKVTDQTSIRVLVIEGKEPGETGPPGRDPKAVGTGGIG